MTEEFDLFASLAKLGGRDDSWYKTLSPTSQKSVAPFVLARWMTGTNDVAQIVRINSLVNGLLFSPSFEKPELLKLLAAAATGKTKRYFWLKGPTVKTQKLKIEAIKQYYDCSGREALTYKVAAEDVLEMADSLGWTKEDIAKLKKELDDGSGTPKKPSSKPKKSRST